MMKSVENNSSVTLKSTMYSALPGWEDDDCEVAFSAFKNQALEIQRKGSGFSRSAIFGGHHTDWLPAVHAAAVTKNAKMFFTENFRCFTVCELDRPEGLFTGYFEPTVLGSRDAHPDYPVPIYRRPHDLVAFDADEAKNLSLKYGRRTNNKAAPYFDRQSIEEGALAGQKLELCWLKNWVEAYFIHIQGSGRVQLTDGTVLRLSYAAKSGLPYTSIGSILVERGILSPSSVSMQTLSAWMLANPSDARKLMWQNQSFIFFREINVKDPNLGAIGAAQVHLTSRASMAIDRQFWMFGTPMWVDSQLPIAAGGKPWQRMMIAQDTGSAILGAARGDVYWGWGEEAAMIAGNMKSKGMLHVLLPHAVAQRLGLPT